MRLKKLFTLSLLILGSIAHAQEECEPVVLTIKTALNMALDNNRNIIGTYEAHERAEINLEINESFFDFQVTPNTTAGISGGGKWGLGPAFGGGVNVAKKFESGTWVSTEPSIYKRGKHYESNVKTVISQPLLRGFGREYNLSAVRGAQFLLRTSNRGVYSNQIALILKTLTQLYNVVRTQESLDLHQSSFNRLKGYRDAAKLKEKIGLSDAEDVYRAETAFKQAEETLNTSKEQYEEALDQLRDTLALSLDTPIVVDIPVKYQFFQMDQKAAIETALKNRLEVEQVQDAYEETVRLSKIAKENLLPELNVVFTYNSTGIGRYLVDSYRYKRDNTWNIGFATSTDVNKSADCLAYQQALVAIGCAQRIVDQTEANIIMEVKRTLRQIERIDKRIEVQQVQIKNAQGELKLAQLKFDRGYADNFNVIQAERNLISAKSILLNAVIDHIIGQYQLLSVLGVLADKPNSICR